MSSLWVYSGAPGVLNDGVRQGGSGGWWQDHPSGPKPAWSTITWNTPRTLNKVVLRMPVVVSGFTLAERTQGELRVDSWDGDSWEAIDAPGNPIEDWVVPETDDGSQIKTLEFDQLSTTSIRVYVEEANAAGDTGLEEIEAYGLDACTPVVNVAAPGNGGEVSVSSNAGSSGGAAVLTDGARQGGGGGWWQDDPGDTDPGWAKVEWGSAQELSKVVLRMPVADGGSYTLPDRTHGEAVLQFWDGDSWETIDADDNPIDEWIVPTTDDGSQIKTFEFDPISTTKIRFLEIEGNAYGHAGLEEIEAYPPPPPPPLTEDTNLALPANDGEVTASSTASGAGDPETLNDGTQQGGASGWWADDPIGPEPASAELAWPTEQAVDKLVLRMPVTGASSGDRTFGELVAEYWDGDSWEEIAASGNPIEDWEAPTTEDGSEVKTLEFDEISTTKIRVSFTEGNANSDAWLEEIEAYGPATCPPQADTNYALVGNGGEVTVSSLWTYSGAPGTLNNGVDQAGGIWQDHPSGEKPAWAQVTWGSEQTLNRIGLRVPIIWGGASVGELTFGEIVVQFWDGDSWEDIDAAGNPIEDWLMPTIDDGSQVKSLSFDPIATTKIRIRFNEANSSGDAAFEEIEAYGPTA